MTFIAMNLEKTTVLFIAYFKTDEIKENMLPAYTI